MKKILVATDGSPTASAAIDTALQLAEHDRATIVFVRVASILDLTPTLNGDAVPPRRMPRTETDPVLQDALALAGRHGVEATAELVIGTPAAEIVRLANDIDADIIVVGSRGLGAFKGAVLGSTSRDVLGLSKRPVLVVRTEAKDRVSA